MIADVNLGGIDAGTHRYHWRGVPMVKSPFDLALLPMLLWRQAPRTVFEFGAYLGGSATWMADLLRAFEVEATVIAVDRRVPGVLRDDIEWIQAEIGQLDLGALAGLRPHPWLVIDDADHQASSVTRVLDAFGPMMAPGDRFVIEDGVLTEMGRAAQFSGGPLAAVRSWLAGHPEFAVDRELCDFWGPNVTWNPDGYLVRLED